MTETYSRAPRQMADNQPAPSNRLAETAIYISQRYMYGHTQISTLPHRNGVDAIFSMYSPPVHHRIRQHQQANDLAEAVRRNFPFLTYYSCLSKLYDITKFHAVCYILFSINTGWLSFVSERENMFLSRFSTFKLHWALSLLCVAFVSALH